MHLQEKMKCFFYDLASALDTTQTKIFELEGVLNTQRDVITTKFQKVATIV
jgi:hypothetical protein